MKTYNRSPDYLQELSNQDLLYELTSRGYLVLDSSAKSVVQKIWERYRIHQNIDHELRTLFDTFDLRI